MELISLRVKTKSMTITPLEWEIQASMNARFKLRIEIKLALEYNQAKKQIN